ncbi:MAG TPA: hypothetical protein VJA47_04660 [archaeon]|nr:hypothetical protein [archaeon]
MGRFLNTVSGLLIGAIGLYGCSSNIDATKPIITNVPEIVKNIKKYEGKAVGFDGPAFARRSGYQLNGFLDADGTDRTTNDRIPLVAAPIITERNNIEMEHRMDSACELLSGDRGTPHVRGVVRKGVFEVYEVTVTRPHMDKVNGVLEQVNTGVYMPLKGVKFNF